MTTKTKTEEPTDEQRRVINEIAEASMGLDVLIAELRNYRDAANSNPPLAQLLGITLREQIEPLRDVCDELLAAIDAGGEGEVH